MGSYYRGSSQFMVDFIYSGQLLVLIVAIACVYGVYRYVVRRRQGK